MDARRYIANGANNSCYFRTSVSPPWRKAVIQITERCDLHCAHCFVSSTSSGRDMSLANVVDHLLPQLVASGVLRVTLTGGEPLAHPDLVPMVTAIVEHNLSVGICTNGSSITKPFARALARIGHVHVNLSLDGFRPESHGRFRGSPASFHATRRGAEVLAEFGLLQGILSTPHALIKPGEYKELYHFARDLDVEYLLLNPMARLGRGFLAHRALAVSAERLEAIRDELLSVATNRPELVFIRFPSPTAPAASCEAGRIFYVYATGRAVVCPYLDFAAQTPLSRHQPDEFTLTNVFLEGMLPARLDEFDAAKESVLGPSHVCGSCPTSGGCGRGCPAAVVAAGATLGSVDREACPESSLLGAHAADGQCSETL